MKKLDVVFVIKPVKREGRLYYQLGIVSRSEVPDFGPFLPPYSLFLPTSEFREYLYAKCKQTKQLKKTTIIV